MKFDHSKKPPLVSSRPAAAQKLLTAKSAEKTDAKIAEKNESLILKTCLIDHLNPTLPLSPGGTSEFHSPGAFKWRD